MGFGRVSELCFGEPDPVFLANVSGTSGLSCGTDLGFSYTNESGTSRACFVASRGTSATLPSASVSGLNVRGTSGANLGGGGAYGGSAPFGERLFGVFDLGKEAPLPVATAAAAAAATTRGVLEPSGAVETSP